ncbi:MAG: hypothetical protein PUF37_07805 [Prevotellaceae bacterium]|nr:hypothetical protein [Prevotellaceae bacterium]
MIQGQVTVCGTINTSATPKTAKDGSKFFAFSITIPLQGRDESVCELTVHLSVSGDKALADKFTTGRHILANGHLNVRKEDGTTYYNIRCDGTPEFVKTSEQDRIEGSLTFTGALSNNGVAFKKTKKGKDFQVFDAWSSDKDKDGKREFIWVHFINLHPTDDTPTKPKTYIEATGDLEVEVWKTEPRIHCNVKTVKEHQFESKK